MTKARSKVALARSLFVFLAAGPLVGWIAMLIQVLLMGEYSNEGLASLLALLVIGIPYAYGFGGAAAIFGGLAYWALRRRYQVRTAMIVVTVAGALIGPLGAVMLWLLTPAGSDDLFAQWQYYLLSSGCAA